MSRSRVDSESSRKQLFGGFSPPSSALWLPFDLDSVFVESSYPFVVDLHHAIRSLSRAFPLDLAVFVPDILAPYHAVKDWVNPSAIYTFSSRRPSPCDAVVVTVHNSVCTRFGSNRPQPFDPSIVDFAREENAIFFDLPRAECHVQSIAGIMVGTAVIIATL